MDDCSFSRVDGRERFSIRSKTVRRSAGMASSSDEKEAERDKLAGVWAAEAVEQSSASVLVGTGSRKAALRVVDVFDATGRGSSAGWEAMSR